MIDLAIVIGVSKYGAPNDLPGCENDAKAIHKILTSDSKFEEVLLLNDQTTASSIKSRLAEFVERFRGQEVNDLFFYFTGHGEFYEDEFYFLPSDYDSSRRKRTSLENGELDTYLRSIEAKLTVKIIDACQSGVRYVKDPNLIPKYLESSKSAFKKCYFYFSSQSNESSYQDEKLSFFTRAIVESITSHTEKTIRYKDISDFCSDYFHESPEQTPFFIQQADLTEVFITIPEAMPASLEQFLESDTNTASKDLNPDASLLELIVADAQRYCGKETADQSLVKLAGFVTTSGMPDLVSELFTVEKVEENDFAKMPNSTAIGKFVADNRQKFFARPYYQSYTAKKRVHKNPLLSSISIPFLSDDDTKEITTTENRIVGYRPTTEMPFLYLIVRAEPKHENLDFHECYIVPIISKTEIQLFTNFCRYFNTSWDDREIEGSRSWETWACGLKHAERIEAKVTEIMSRFWRFVIEPLEKKYLGPTGPTGPLPPSEPSPSADISKPPKKTKKKKSE